MRVQAVPAAKVYAGGAYAGETPKRCLCVPAGDRRVSFEANGQRSPDRFVRVTGQRTAKRHLPIRYDFREREFTG